MGKEPIQVWPSWGNDKWSDPDSGIQIITESGSDTPIRSLNQPEIMKDIESQAIEYAEALNDIADVLDMPTGATAAEIVERARNRWASGIHTCHERYPREKCSLSGLKYSDALTVDFVKMVLETVKGGGKVVTFNDGDIYTMERILKASDQALAQPERNHTPTP